MLRLKTKILSALAALSLSVGGAQAASIAPGDNFQIDYLVDGALFTTTFGTVGAGADSLPFGGALSIDVNAGGGDSFTVTTAGDYCGFFCTGNEITMVFTDLNFDEDFEVNNFLDSTTLGASFAKLSPTSFSITWTDPNDFAPRFTGGEVAFSGTFSSIIAAVPLPASAPLALFGIGALVMMRKSSRRRRRFVC